MTLQDGEKQLDSNSASSKTRVPHMSAITRFSVQTLRYAHLAAEKPDLFRGGPTKLRDKSQPPTPQDMKVSAAEFDEAVRAIDDIWEAYESASLGRPLENTTARC